ncbi:uncharacterized protein SPPG_09146 [Spizellomyces punctatus DAOM BR117]|uniref:Paired domain-containing protein n=1 Tax=Spizellomyces punctatus (strain DAOM BR117) TaxID=645134 RepID=A0A0L0HII4_SPIPD|nr:uncharacterized protein SPPG_09146 [Spizellomyces punctatus DAOM BR117]KND00680.1 hypothetical protein SPPG_09146 [Spizellomyces punctatus DAOM BR117]|eukprot:XP_016608719.1 hypothetical protein SPPG_09146 [Spizellomyces punctatus DAOM BR117]
MENITHVRAEQPEFPQRRAEHSDFVKGKVIGLHQGGHSTRQMAHILVIPQSTVSNIIIRYRTTGSVTTPKRPGRPRAATPEQLAIIKNTVLALRCSPLRVIKHELETKHGIKFHYQTLLAIIYSLGLRSNVAPCKPYKPPVGN